MQKFIVIADEAWPTIGRFHPHRVPASCRIETFDVEEHWQKIGYLLLLQDDVIVIDGVGIKAHRPLAQLYWFLQQERTYDEGAFCDYEQTILGGWIWPPVPILMGSTSYPEKITPDQQHELIRTFLPDNHLEYTPDQVFWDYGGFTRRTVEKK